MVDFKGWQCRTCNHYHTLYVGSLRPENKCSNEYVLPSHSAYGCMCNEWTSSDNLIYLEQLSEKKDRI